MKARVAFALLIAFLFGSASLSLGAAEPFDVPKLDGLTIDGRAADWGDRGFRVDFLTSDDGKSKVGMLSANAGNAYPLMPDFDPSFRLGWDEQGLLLLATVRDDVAVENPAAAFMWQEDSLETWIGSDKDGKGEYLQVILGPGIDPKTPGPRAYIFDRKRGARGERPIQVASTKVEGGYVLEVRYPWASLGITAREGAEFRYGLWVNDADKLGDSFQVVWTPRMTAGDIRASHLVRLATHASAPVAAGARGSYLHLRTGQVTVWAKPSAVGKTAEVRVGGKVVGKGVFEEKEGRALTTIEFPPVARGAFEAMVYLDGRPMAGVPFGDLADERAFAVTEMGAGFNPCVFRGEDFPKFNFDDPATAEGALGKYSVKSVFYDAQYREVTSAQAPGRYGAVVTVTPSRGKALTYYRTLVALPPDEAGIKKALAVLEPEQQDLEKNGARDPEVAAVLAWRLDDRSVDSRAQALAQDRQWWVGLKRKLNGMEKTYPADFHSPRPKEGAPATTLHTGTLAEAGMKPDTVARLDALLNKWAGDSDQAFAVFIARHGVIVLDKAYGVRDGHPMAVTDQSWMASISKLLAGTSFMMAVDQGRLNLDAPVSDYLPAFRGVKTNRVITLRHLCNHTAGLWGHFGDNLHDFDQLIAWYAPYLAVGGRFQYNGADLAVAGKALEMVAGEALPVYYQRHLLDPLGCTNTEITTCSWDARSTARDIATIAQMLLNKGAYGHQRFLSEAAVEQMRPAKVTAQVSWDKDTEYGIGTQPFRDEGLSDETWGHGAASAATLRIDPVNDLVVTMTRNEAGRNYDLYHPQFLKLVGECVVR